MVKPMGVVAMLILLASGPASAGERIFAKHVDIWGVTTTGSLYLETQQGEIYTAELKHCPVNTMNSNFSPIQLVKQLSDIRISLPGRHVAEARSITIKNFDNKEKVVCKLGELVKHSG